MSRRGFFGVVTKLLAIFGFCLGFSAIPGFAQAAGNAPTGLARALKAQEKHTNGLLAKAGVWGTAVGLDARGNHAVKVYVETAKDAGGIANKLDGVPVDVEVTGPIFALKPPEGKGPKGGDSGGDSVDPTARFDRPVPIGVSTGHPAITAGTIGCRVVDADGHVYALSNNHVYANQNDAKAIFRSMDQMGDPVIQPGAYDGGSLNNNPSDFIGTLADFEDIKFDGSANTIDAAIAMVDSLDLDNATPSDGYGMPKSETVAAAVGMNVMKYGRTTGLTQGKVEAVNGNFFINYGDGNLAYFEGQIVIGKGRFSAGGDSGSLIVDAERRPVGLLFAGSRTVTIANPIGAVLNSFNVTIDGEPAP